MRQIEITTTIHACAYDELSTEERQLIDNAREATKRAYAPYSHYQVGAALQLANGEIITGCNQENAAYPSGLCAERVALFYAGATYPDVPVTALAVAIYTQGDFTADVAAPCAACRQVMLETESRYGNDMKILLVARDEVYCIESAKALVPLYFNKDNL